jgi:hypothetical protein
MDQNGNFLAGEEPNDAYVAEFILEAPRVTSHSP